MDHAFQNVFQKINISNSHLLVIAAAVGELAAEEDCEEGDEEDEAQGDGHDEEEQTGVLLGVLQQGLVARTWLAGQDQPGVLVPLLAAELARPRGVSPKQTPMHHCFVKALSHHVASLQSFIG